MIKLTACGVPLRAEFHKISVFTLAFIYRQATIFYGNQNKGTVHFLKRNIHNRYEKNNISYARALY